MTKNSFYILLIVSIFFTSCIPVKDLIYLQDKNNSGEQNNNIAQVESKPYRLQVNDVLSVTIKAIDPKFVSIFSPTESGADGKSESALYFDGFTVDDHGNIRMPILGEINVIGYTLEEVRLKIEKQLLEEYFKSEANIFVTVKLAGFRYTINGEVGSTGTKTLFQERVNVLEAIANAGDIKTVGDRKSVVIIRQSPTGVQMNSIDLTDVNVMKSPYYYLQPNDYIYVKPLRQKTWGTGETGLQSIGTIITLLSLATTVYFIVKN
ncbi:polysaccharide biosynthesis/export family protein [Flavobacterium johnsoniae]|jgi:polysaccharide export outer membrane protein|uniref:Wza n=1 Tax=Flavobacterium johnsoniae (strain ATCC 17061 / DSM 2064 / JCM 8514 / BCRC 14874 / CCUG 350202 / NBRC 14942 / NCIMB 11054 / UW101) TaxID=376686 RepID=A5FN23_FLAJ1|nr:polysaccharide biosynthesis/export family protein [Flavobacterium johnsoniae]ABQ03397.1 Wza [Flavobacterium johnsoniae UW101]OXG01188.1 sugar transporter [Flavobacterium johnsoniae UW101]WQG79738.1 polysaccharide biosynthesis/export family protein [Flavobacterium johnsoniae UW101]SHL76430.1 protein involved in gliding motility EpsA [Flavobacterium johnsoniae]